MAARTANPALLLGHKDAQGTHYSRPGLTLKGTPPTTGRGRALYAATTGQLYCVINQNVYFIDQNFAYTLIGTLPSAVATPVSIADNGTFAFLVDGSAFGSQIQLDNNNLSEISDPNFHGGTRVDFLDGFVIFNKPNTILWYCTESYSNVFNDLFIGQKTAWPDLIQTLIVNERQAWLFGQYKSEVWVNAGLAPFPFQLLSGNIVEHGIAGPYAVARQDINIYWLSESPEGARMAMQGSYNQGQRISTNAIEEEWLIYSKVSDCICTTYQIRGHPFIHFDFPTADRTWVFDGSTQEWHEEAYFDTNGVQHRTKDTFKAYCYGLNLSLDWSTGQLYQRDESNYSDNGIQIVYRRGFPHLLDSNSFNPITVWRVMADMECGNGTGVITTNPFSAGFSPGFGPTVHTGPSVVLRISRNRGFSFTTHSIQSLGLPGGYNTKPTWNRCGLAYDFVPELQWEGPLHTALNGVFVEIEDSPGYSGW